MRNQGTSWRRAAVVVIATTALALPTLSVVQADQPTQQTQAAKKNLKKNAATSRRQPYAHRNLYGWDQQSGAGPCTSFNNQFPPCMSTWPAGSPNYHGPRPGPTFFDEQ